mgnify:CR=1 FL=1
MPKPHSDRYIFLRVPTHQSKLQQRKPTHYERKYNTTPPRIPHPNERNARQRIPRLPLQLQRPRTYGLRINTSKITCEDFENLSPFPTRQIPWIKNGYFYDEDIRPSRCPYYQAGLSLPSGTQRHDPRLPHPHRAG